MNYQWSNLLEVGESVAEINDFLYEHRMTDGLPVIPPIPELVEQAITYSGLEPDHVIALVPPWWSEATVEKVAANAVMAGCEPKHLPVVIAALEVVTDGPWGLYSAQATTLPSGPFIIVNGPCRDYLGMNYSYGALGPGVRANAAIGRALRLILMNIGGARAGELDLATLGLPGKYTMCLAENEAANPWEPYHVEHGWTASANTVTVIAGNSTVNIWDPDSETGQRLMQTFVGSLRIQGANNFGHGGKGEIILLLGPEMARIIADSGYSKADIREQIWNECALPLSQFSKDVARAIEEKKKKIEDGLVRPANSLEDIHIFVTGGAGRHSVAVLTSKESAATREIAFPEGVDFPVGES